MKTKRIASYSVTIMSLAALLVYTSCKSSASSVVTVAVASQLTVTIAPSASVASGAVLAQQPVLQARSVIGVVQVVNAALAVFSSARPFHDALSRTCCARTRA